MKRIRQTSYEDLLEKARNLPPMTEAQKEEQRRSFAYGNLACSTNHRVSREIVDKVADEMQHARIDARAELLDLYERPCPFDDADECDSDTCDEHAPLLP